MKEITHKQAIHRQYLQSPLWRSVRKNALIQFGEICAKCGGYGTDVHHLTYERVGGNELIEDLQVLCRDCHEALHTIERSTQRSNSKQKIGKKRKGATIGEIISHLNKKQKEIIEKKFLCPLFSILNAPTIDGHESREMAKKMLDIDFILGGAKLNPFLSEKELTSYIN